MTIFIPVDYHGKKYPPGINCKIVEVAGHFDKTSIPDVDRYSLHTEYSFAKRKLNSQLLEKYPALKESYRNVPRLWYNKKWAEEFAEFIFELTNVHPEPEVIEIHPPFIDYCPNFEKFFENYMVFEDKIRTQYPNSLITLENRAGAQYPYKFLMGSVEEVAKCCEYISDLGANLSIAVDYPQLFTAEKYDYSSIPIQSFIEKHALLSEYRHLISSIHLWGKKQNRRGTWVSHSSGLRSILDEDDLSRFMSMLSSFYNDGIERYFVPEINSSSMYVSELVELCKDFGITFSE